MNSPANSHPAEHEERLLQYLDGQLPAAEARALEAHLARCAECQTLCRQWQQIESPLVRVLGRPRLSPDFNARLRRRVLAESEAGATAGGRRESQDSTSQPRPAWSGARLYHSWPLWFRLLDGFGCVAAAAMGGYYLFRLALPWLPASSPEGVAFLNSPAFALALAAAAAALLVGANLGARNRLLRWLTGF